MQGDNHAHASKWWHGPRLWVVSAIVGALAGYALTFVLPARFGDDGKAIIPIVLVAPFALLLLSIAICPLVNARWWHRHYPDVAFFLGAVVATYYVVGFHPPASTHASTHAWSGAGVAMHTAIEYVAFIALIGGLYVASGGILAQLSRPISPAANTLFLAGGAVLANLVGTTGASMLLIRPFMRANEGRLRPLHVVFFIFIVSNCGGLLTPVGDPPLYLGFVKGVPFFWTLEHMWQSWIVVNLLLLGVFFAYDELVTRRLERAGTPREPAGILPRVRIVARPHTLLLMALMVGAVFLDPVLSRFVNLHHVPFGAIVQIALAVIAFVTAPKEILDANEFSFEPVKEVGLLFAGIFATMMPALGYLAANGAQLGVDSPSAFYFATGGLSGVLDNAPTYLNFVQVSVAPDEVTRDSLHALLTTGAGVDVLHAISAGAVFFGAMTYIGNGPNFMVRSIAERAGVKMPSFFAYALWALALLLPVLVVHWVVLVR
jgi:Na+/H+ antiporter NhaD/arsenite permease-like protein